MNRIALPRSLWTGMLLVALSVLPHGSVAAAGSGDDVAAARKIFEANLDAIRHKDRVAYLACYENAEALVKTGPEGFTLGYASHAAETSDTSWPDLFDAQDLRLAPISPGVVYGTYRYRVRYGQEEHSGLSERIFIKTDAGWRIAMTSAVDAPPGTPPPPRAIAGGTLVDGTGAAPVKDAVVLMRGGKIECAGSRAACPVPEGVGIVDASGLYVTPGVVDAHMHFSQTGWADGRPDTLDVRDRHPYDKVVASLRANPERWFRSYLCSGVTAVYDVGGYPWTWALRDRSENDRGAPHIAAAGPLLSTRDAPLNLPAERQFIYLSDEKAAKEGVRYVASQGTNAVKIWFIVTPDRAFEEMAAAVRTAGEEARRERLPLIVHATGLKEAKEALKAGARLLVHSVWDQPVDVEFIDLMKRNGAIYTPTLTVAEGYRRMFASVLSGQPPAVDDPLGCVDGGTLTLVEETARVGSERVSASAAERLKQPDTRGPIMAANLKRVRDAGITIAMGTDAGNPLTLHGASVFAEMEAMEAAGLTPMQVIVGATRGGAAAMGREKDLGTLEAGKIADLLIVAADPTAKISNFRQIRYVVRGGEARSQEELRAPHPR